MDSSTGPEAPSAHHAGSSDSSEPSAGLEIRCPCCNAGIVLEDIALRVVQGPSPRRVLTLAMDDPSLGLDETVQEVQRQLVRLALRQSQGVKARAAELVGLKYSTFWETAERLGCDEIPEGDDAADESAATDGPPGVAEASLQRVERVVVLRKEAEGPPLEIQIPVTDDGSLLRRVARQVKLALARRALDRAEGNVARAAEIAGMKYTTFYSFLNRLPAEALDEPGDGT